MDEITARLRDGLPVAYVCSPFAGDMEGNTERARQYCRWTWTRGGIPLAPHLLFPRFMDDRVPAEREAALTMGRKLLGMCDLVLVFGGVITRGMAAEIAEASGLGLPIYCVPDADALPEAWEAGP